MLARLEDETHDLCEQASADRFSVLDDPTLAGYRRFLATIYHFEYSVEARLIYVPELPIRFLAENLRSGLLGDDLLALGSDRTTMAIFARSIDLPRLRDGSQAFGWWYALQRNTLHHGPLVRALAPLLRNAMRIASRYLTAHASSVYERWHMFGAHLDAAAATPERANAIVAAARDALRLQHAWFLDARSSQSVHVSQI